MGMQSITFGSLFAGIGGFDLGLEQAGMRSLWNVEREPTCRQLLASKFPHAAQFDDVRTVGAHNLKPVDLICGGFPCQDLSVAGKRAGLKGARSGLFYELARITNELRPAFLLWENVPGLLSSDGGRDFARVLIELDRIGYHGAWRVLDAQYLGVAQRRRRIFGLFARVDIGAARCAEVLSLAEGMRGHPAPSREARETIAGTLGGSTQSGGFRTTDLDQTGAFIPECARSINAGRDGYNDGSDQTYIPEVCGCLNDGAHQGGGSTDRTPTPDASLPPVAWALQERDSKGVDSSTKDGHLIPTRRGGFFDGVTAFDPTQITSRENRSKPTPGAPCHTLAKGAHAPAVAFQPRIARNGRGQPSEVVPALNGTDAGETSDMRPCVTSWSGVRRLTPRECERLQGFPDDWTAGFSDSTRYKMLGNAVAVPCSRWIGLRLVAKLRA